MNRAEADQRTIVLLVSSVLVVDAALYTALTPLLPTLQRDLDISDSVTARLALQVT